MIALCRNVLAHRELCLSFARREIAARYAQSLLGPAWALGRPAALLAVFALVARLLHLPSGDAPYPLFLAAGLAPWSIFASAVSAAAPSVVQNAAIVRKVYFPREVLPVAALLASIVDAAVTLAALAVAFAAYGVAPTRWVLLLPGLVAIELVFALAVAMAVGALATHARDLLFGSAFALELAVYACPVIYPLEAVPEAFRAVYLMNPIATVVAAFRACLLGPASPDLASVAVAAGVSALALAIAHRLFKRLEPTMADVV